MRRAVTPAVARERVDQVRHTQKHPPARGHPHRGQLGTVVYFDPEMHAKVRAMAVSSGVSFAEAVRTLCEWGLEADG